MAGLVRTVVAILVICTALSVGVVPALAAGEEPETTDLGTIDVTISDERIHVSDVEVEGEGLPELTIEKRDVTIDSASVRMDGVTIDYGDRTYEIASVDVEIRDVGVTLEDVSIGSTS